MKRKVISFVLVFLLLFGLTGTSLASTGRLKRPTIYNVNTSSTYVKIYWSDISGADEYDIYRARSEYDDFEYFKTVDSSPYKDEQVTQGNRYYYKVRALSYEYPDSKLSKWRSGKVKTPAPTRSVASVSQTVYVTRTGSKYHRFGCRYLRTSCISISLNNARDYGYSACSACW